MKACDFLGEDDYDSPHSPCGKKAAWRRQNTEHLGYRHHHSSKAQSLPKTAPLALTRRRKSTLRNREPRRHKSKSESTAKILSDEPLAVTKKAQWQVQLPDWFRNTLCEYGEFSMLLEAELDAPQNFASGSEMDAAVFPGDDMCSSSGSSSSSSDDELVRADAPAPVAPDDDEPLVRSKTVQAPPVIRPGVSAKEAECQCTPEDIVQSGGEPMAPSPLGQALCLRKIRAASLGSRTSYSVSLHFSLFEDASKIAKMAGDLNAREHRTLADRFFGREIAGLKVQRGCRSCRRVAERHVTEAALISQDHQAFREGLLMSSKRLLLGGFDMPPFDGAGLLRLAHQYPEEWAKILFTAMDFAGRLIKVGALPRAFAAELLAGLAELPPSAESGKMLVLGLLIVVPAVKMSAPGYSRFAGSRRSTLSASSRRFSGGSLSRFDRRRRSSTSSATLAAELAESLGIAPAPLERTRTAPARLYSTVRAVGTSLHLQDDFQPYAFISVNKATKKGAAVEFGPPIPPDMLPDYWRHAAGGEHLPEALEQRALKAAEELEAAEDSAE